MYNPREDDNLGIMAFTNNRYLSGDKGATLDKAEAAVKAGAIWLPVYAYIHSGQTVSTRPFSCPWDSGRIGTIYCTLADAREWFGVKHITETVKAQVIERLIDEVKEYDDYINGVDED
jgi:hypothetical protein